MRVIAVLLLISLAVVFTVSFFRPAKSRRMQERVKALTDKYADKARERAGEAGDKTAEGIEKIGRATQSVAHAGRRAHDKVFHSTAGAEEERKLREEYGEGAERGKD
ncbi:MAG TPA: hypothetical protein VF053_02225 [Streptosporangiales bacterium]